MLSVCTVFEASGHRLVSIWPLEAVPCQTFSPISFILSTISKSFVSSDYSFYDIGPFAAFDFDCNPPPPLRLMICYSFWSYLMIYRPVLSLSLCIHLLSLNVVAHFASVSPADSPGCPRWPSFGSVSPPSSAEDYVPSTPVTILLPLPRFEKNEPLVFSFMKFKWLSGRTTTMLAAFGNTISELLPTSSVFSTALSV